MKIKAMNETGSAVARKRVADKSRQPAQPKGNGAAAADSLSQQEAKAILQALTALKQGDSDVRLPIEWTGLQGKVAETFNEVVELNARMAEELARLRQKVGKEGKLKQRAEMNEVRGFWRDQIHCVNALIDELVHPTSEDRSRDRRGGAGRTVPDLGLQVETAHRGRILGTRGHQQIGDSRWSLE